MTQTSIKDSGFIVSDDTCIWGRGATADAAWADMLREMAMARIEVLSDAEADAHENENDGNWTRASSFTTQPASAALLAEVEARGGNIAWGDVGGVACTRDEENGEDA